MDSKICPVCGTENNGPAKFCRKCGGSLEVRFGGGKTEMDPAVQDIQRKKGTLVDPQVEPVAQHSYAPPPSHGPRQRKATIVEGGSPVKPGGNMEGGRAPQGGGRVLVGFLVTFDMDDAPQGRFFPLYQGRTLIGRDMDPTMGAVVDVRGDLKVSGSHALLLHRNGKLIMEDQMSTCGTFVDESTLGIAGRSELVGGPQFVRDDGAMFCGRPVKLYSIENEKVELYDNSIIAVGKTLMQVKLIGWPERALIY